MPKRVLAATEDALTPELMKVCKEALGKSKSAKKARQCAKRQARERKNAKKAWKKKKKMQKDDSNDCSKVESSAGASACAGMEVDSECKDGNLGSSGNAGGGAEMNDVLEEKEAAVREDEVWWINGGVGLKCDNCCRQVKDNDPNSPYHFRLCEAHPIQLKEVKTPLRRIELDSDDSEQSFRLCECCYTFMARSTEDKTRYSWKNVWPSFFWDMLVGEDKCTGKPFRDSYTPEYLWKFVPSSLRTYWLDSLQDIDGYSTCTSSYPLSYFEDRTSEINRFKSNLSSGTYKGLLRALDPARLSSDTGEVVPISSILPNVLCPWGCGEYCFQAKDMLPSLLIQHHLRKVQLNLIGTNGGIGHSSLHLCSTSRSDYFRRDYETNDYVMLNEKWKVSPGMRLTSNGLMCLVCRHHHKASDQKVLYPHPPRKPLNNLSSVHASNLCQTVLRPRSLKPNISSKCGTQTSIRQLDAGFTGIDSANVTTDNRFAKSSYMLYQDETLSLMGRRDICDFADVMVREKKIQHELRTHWAEGVSDRWEEREEDLDALKRGSTYCPTKNAIILQVTASDTSKIAVFVKGKVKDGQVGPDKLVYVPRSWDAITYNMQVEDGENYGVPLQALIPYQCKGKDRQISMMLWSLVGLVSGCSDLHYAIDQKQAPFHFAGVSGHLLCHIASQYMKHRTNNTSKLSPFSASTALGIERLWNVITQRSQWTDYMDSLLDSWSIEGDGDIIENDSTTHVLDLATTFPYKACNVTIPQSNSGFVYLLVSTVASDRTYVGQTRNLAIRLQQHNSGYGSTGTAHTAYLPYAVAAYLTDMSHLTPRDRMMLEWKWKYLNHRSVTHGIGSMETRINNGRQVMDEYNNTVPRENHIKMVLCIQRVAMENDPQIS